MDIETVKAKMCAQLKKARDSGFAKRFDWNFMTDENDELITYVTMRKGGNPDARFLLRIAFHDFPKRPPSYLFVDLATKKNVETAWPKDARHPADGNGGICTPGTREFHEIIHPNEAKYAWDSERYTVLEALAMTQRIMDQG